MLSLEAALLIFIFGCVAIGLATRRPLHETFPAMAISAGAILFVVLPFSYVVRLNEIERVGKQLLLFTLCLLYTSIGAITVDDVVSRLQEKLA